MPEKYFITNGDKTVEPKSCVEVALSSSAKRFKYMEALKFIDENIKDIGWSAQKVYSSSGGKNYIITNASNFVSYNKAVTNVFKNAKPFRSVADAEAYIRKNSTSLKNFGTPFIIDEYFNVMDQNAKHVFTDEQLRAFGAKHSQARVVAPKVSKIKLYENASQKCSICGKPLEYNEMTIDHIVPISRGGTNKISNLRCTCNSCNSLKNNLLDDEMYNRIVNICSVKAFNDPDNNLWDMIIRAKVRGEINKYVSRRE